MATSVGSMDDVAKIFNKFDTNGDGKISKSELTAVLAALGFDAPPPEIEKMMAEMDKDGDGAVDLADFAAFHSFSGEATAELRAAFEVYDKDGDGKISARELHVVMRGLGEKCTVQDCERMIAGAVNVDWVMHMAVRGLGYPHDKMGMDNQKWGVDKGKV